MRIAIVTGVLVFLLDQITKYIVLYRVFDLSAYAQNLPEGVRPYPPSVDVLAPFLVLRMAWNEGINFGLFAQYDLRWVLIGIAVAVSIFVLWWIRKERPGRMGLISAGFLVGGALANVIDRVIYGAVADFLNMSCCGFENPYAFNIADIAIFVGAVGLVLFGSNEGSGNKTA